MMAPVDITFDGLDVNEQGQTYLVTPYINVWRDWGNRAAGVVTIVTHGTRGKLLERRGQRCRVEVAGMMGFVTFWFIQELKGDWLAQRRQEMAPGA